MSIEKGHDFSKEPAKPSEEKTNSRLTDRMLKLKVGEVYTIEQLSQILDLRPEQGLVEFLNKHAGWKRIEKGKFQLLEKRNLEKPFSNKQEEAAADLLLSTMANFTEPFDSSGLYAHLANDPVAKKLKLNPNNIYNILMQLYSQGKIKYYPPSKNNPRPMFEK